MKTNDSELYVLLDGTYAAPGACSKGDDGVLRGANGVPVAMTDEGDPMTVRRQVDLGGNALAAAMGKADEGQPLAKDEPMAAAENQAEVQNPAAPRSAAPAFTPAAPAPAPAPAPAASESKSDNKSDPSKTP